MEHVAIGLRIPDVSSLMISDRSYSCNFSWNYHKTKEHRCVLIDQHEITTCKREFSGMIDWLWVAWSRRERISSMQPLTSLLPAAIEYFPFGLVTDPTSIAVRKSSPHLAEAPHTHGTFRQLWMEWFWSLLDGGRPEAVQALIFRFLLIDKNFP